MRATEMPGCCACTVLWDLRFNGATREARVAELKAAAREHLTRMKLVLATTSTGDAMGRDHRQRNEVQAEAEACLLEVGFTPSGPARNENHHHANTAVRLWRLRRNSAAGRRLFDE